jgi:hypothetical protein
MSFVFFLPLHATLLTAKPRMLQVVMISHENAERVRLVLIQLWQSE